MNPRYRAIGQAVALVSVLALAVSLYGCGGGGSGTSGGSGTLSVRLADAPAPDVTDLTVTIDRVEANVDGTWTPITTSPQSFNLLDLVTDDTLLGSATLPAGHYTQIRLFASSATVTDSTGTYSVKMPSEAKTGIKLNVDYDIGSNQVTAILLDFNVNKSLVREGNGQYLLKPVIPAVVKVESGTITGTVTDGTNAVAGATVTAVYTAGTSYTIGTQVNTSMTLADGTFKIWALLPGTYEVDVSYTDAGGTTHAGTATGVVVTANANTDAGTIVAN